MNPKRLFLAIVVVFIGIFATDFLIHGVLLKSDYAQTQNLWRTETGMQKYFQWLLLGQLLAAVTFVCVWAKGFAALKCLRCACIYGIMMALFGQANSLITYAVQPIPGEIIAKWFFSAIAQGVAMGILVFVCYKPKPLMSPKTV
ncbi:MAG: hypothetical protein ABJC04_09395 [Verrucomicrobiota bacterium]